METTKNFNVQGMTCHSCELRIEKALQKIDGVSNVTVKYSDSTLSVSFDPTKTDISQIITTVEQIDYTLTEKQTAQPTAKSNLNNSDVSNGSKGSKTLNILGFLGICIIIFAVYFLIQHTMDFSFIPEITPGMSYSLLFVIGLLTSLHCIAMCGGINLSQCLSASCDSSSKTDNIKPSLLYNSGRVVSYTLIGGVIGAFGSVLSLNGTFQGVIVIIAGIFMILMGLSMMNIFPGLRKFVPHMPKKLGKSIQGAASSNKSSKSPFVVGLLNGLMPCGPLQSMQIYALATGSFIAGATSMLAFSLGTVPLMFGFGAISTLLSARFTKNMLKVSACLVMFLGVIMLSRGLNLSGINVITFGNGGEPPVAASVAPSGETQEVTTQITRRGYPPISVQAGVPVKWTVKANAEDLTSCNGTIVIPEYGIEKTLQAGDNIIEFTPEKTGEIPYSCSMGMIDSEIIVVDPIAQTNGETQEVTTQITRSGYPPISVQAGVPVKWTVKANAEDLTSCNSTIVIPEYGIEKTLQAGDNIIEFTPEKTGEIPYSCSMGMIDSEIIVVDPIAQTDGITATATPISDNINATASFFGQEQPSPATDNYSETLGESSNMISSSPNGSRQIPTDDIQIATEVNGVQELNVTVDSAGYHPSVMVIERGKDFKINFNAEELSLCNSLVYFPNTDLTLDLATKTQTPVMTAENDTMFQCGMNMLHGYIKVVDDIDNVDLESVGNDVESFNASISAGGCCSF